MRIGRLAVLVLAAGPLSCVSPPASRPALAPGVAQALWDGWRAEVSDRHALRCTARLAVDGQGTRLRSKQRVVVALPARLRVEIQGFLGTTAGVLTVDDSEYALLQGEPRAFESGPVHDALLSQVVAVDLAPMRVVELLLGTPERDVELVVAGGVQTEAGWREIQLEPNRMARFDSEGRLRAYRVAESDDDPGWEVEFEDYSRVDGSFVAQRVTLDLSGGTRAVLILRDIELNPTLSPDIFRLDEHGPVAGPAGMEGG